MQPTRQTLGQPIVVAGISVRTTNAAEFNPATGKIPSLWVEFFANELHSIKGKHADSPNYGVYSAYESDHTGAFDVWAGVAVDASPEAEAFNQVTLQPGAYLVFAAQGPMPQAVLQAWAAAWQYFQVHPEVARRYATDFESYTSPHDVSVHVGVVE